MSEKRFTLEQWTEESLYYSDGEYSAHMSIGFICEKVEKKLNEQQDIITEQKEKVARVLNKYSRQFKRHSKEFSFMLDLAEDLGVKSLEAKDD